MEDDAVVHASAEAERAGERHAVLRPALASVTPASPLTWTGVSLFVWVPRRSGLRVPAPHPRRVDDSEAEVDEWAGVADREDGGGEGRPERQPVGRTRPELDLPGVRGDVHEHEQRRDSERKAAPDLDMRRCGALDALEAGHR